MITFGGRFLCLLRACLVIITLHSTLLTLNSKTLTDTIPLTFEYNMPVVKADINGKPRRFLLDTGSSASLIMLGTGDIYEMATNCCMVCLMVSWAWIIWSIWGWS